MLKPKDWGDPVKEAQKVNAKTSTTGAVGFLDMSAFADSDMAAEAVA